jgi:hypothetical protein
MGFNLIIQTQKVIPGNLVNSANRVIGGTGPIGGFAIHFRGKRSTMNLIHLLLLQADNGCFVEIKLFVESFGFHFRLSSEL